MECWSELQSTLEEAGVVGLDPSVEEVEAAEAIRAAEEEAAAAAAAASEAEAAAAAEAALVDKELPLLTMTAILTTYYELWPLYLLPTTYCLWPRSLRG